MAQRIRSGLEVRPWPILTGTSETLPCQPEEVGEAGKSVLDFAILLGFVIALGVPIWAVIDAAGHSTGAYQQIGSNKVRWIVLLVVLTLVFNVAGIIASVVYLATVRPRLRDVDAAAISRAGRPHRLDMEHGPSALASDADRELVTKELHRHFEAGRLSYQDLSDRLEIALKARTLGDLQRVLNDLPAE
jgi:hypothetical protein